MNGKFTQKQADIYNLVLKANRAVMKELKPAINWTDMHKLAEAVILEGLLELGLLKSNGKTVQEMVEERVGFIFMPHGLGHLIGLDVHDVGGYTSDAPERKLQPGLKNLRTGRILQNGMTLTVEPGCYFRDFLLEGKLGDKLKVPLEYLNVEKIKEYQKEIAGVRIEDVVLITKDGYENFSELLPRTVEEIEEVMNPANWA